MEMTRQERQLACAYLRSQGWTQEAIANRLSIRAQSQISRDLAKAREERQLVEVVNWPAEARRDEIMAFAVPDLRGLHDLLDSWAIKGGGNHLKAVHIVDVDDAPRDSEPHDSQDAAAQRERVTTFGRRAAAFVGSHLEGATNVAVAWGRTINAMLLSLEAHFKGKLEYVLPVSAEPMNHRAGGVGTTAATEHLAYACDVPDKRRLSLQGVPARLPADLVADEDALKRFVRQSKHYEQIFGEGGLFTTTAVDTIITGIGNATTSKNSADAYFRETDELGGVTNLGEVSCGNLGGVWLPDPDATPEEKEALEQLNKRSLGIQRHHFEGCARAAAADPKRPGVICLAAEPQKATVVREALPMINSIVVSRPLADALLNLAKRETPGG